MNNFKYVACSPPVCNCSSIEVEDGIVYIKDDYDHVVQMSCEEFKMIATEFLDRINRSLGDNDI